MHVDAQVRLQTGSWQGANERGAPGQRNAIDMRQNISDFHDAFVERVAIHALGGETEFGQRRYDLELRNSQKIYKCI
jgi:hypothetical protein